MKKILTLFLLSVLAMGAISCGEPTPEDRLEGQWSYVSVDINNTKPDIVASFILKGTADTYSVNNLVVTVDGSIATDYTTTLEAVTRGEKIGKMTLSKGTNTITLYKCAIISVASSWSVDSVIYMQGTTKFKYVGGSITK